MRSGWKLPFTSNKFNYYNIYDEDVMDEFNSHNDYLRNLVIPSTLDGVTVYVYNGQIDYEVTVNRNMVGRKFGEFSVTKTLGRKFREAMRLRKKKRKKR